MIETFFCTRRRTVITPTVVRAAMPKKSYFFTTSGHSNFRRWPEDKSMPVWLFSVEIRSDMFNYVLNSRVLRPACAHSIAFTHPRTNYWSLPTRCKTHRVPSNKNNTVCLRLLSGRSYRFLFLFYDHCVHSTKVILCGCNIECFFSIRVSACYICPLLAQSRENYHLV